MSTAQPIVKTTSGFAITPGVNQGQCLKGFSFSSTAGATVNLRAGGATGPIIVQIILAANQSTSDFYGDDGVFFEGGVYVDVASGTLTQGSVWF